jgi:peptidyl-prolyl cis-trans isomerase A (cyclophilin A)
MKKLLFILPFFLWGCAAKQAPKTYTATFETTRGDFTIEVQRDLSPAAADRLYQLLKARYYDNTAFYRVVPNFVVQFGDTDTLAMKKWETIKVPDEPVKMGNNRGTLSFARAGKETRAADLFINLRDNNRLDTITYEGVTGFPAFGRVTRGMETVEQLYGGYGDTALEDPNLYANPALFRKAFPKLDTIRKAYLVRK